MYVHLPIYVQQPFFRRSRNGAYGGAVACIDWVMDLLLYELRCLGLEQNTLVVFTSDNGSRGDHGGSNAPLRGAKGSTWEGGQRVPCIMYWPGVIPAGTVCRELASALDFLPTFAGLAGTTAPTDRIIDGCDLRDLLFKPGAPSPRQTFFYFFKDQLEAVRAGRWKLHVAKRGHEMLELYDLQNDPGESRNVASDHPDVVTQLQELQASCRADLGDSRTGVVGRNRRLPGKVANPRPLTVADPDAYPFIAAEYDLSDRG
jgi:arylsulfatase A